MNLSDKITQACSDLEDSLFSIRGDILVCNFCLIEKELQFKEYGSGFWLDSDPAQHKENCSGIFLLNLLGKIIEEMKQESYLERAARLEFELRETGICQKGCCSPETLEAERIMQEAIKNPIDGKNSKPLPVKKK